MFKKAVFYDYTETEKGALFKVHVPGWVSSVKFLERFIEGGIYLDDGISITKQQRKLVYALIRDISMYTGYTVEELKELMKINFMVDKNRDYFSLSDVTRVVATEFIEYLLEFMFAFNIPINKKVIVLAKEVNNYLFLCLKHRKCAVCGSHADIHHHENLVGMGMDRAKHNHEDSRYIALCRIHHTECHAIGHKTFEQKYHLQAIKLRKEVIKELGI